MTCPEDAFPVSPLTANELLLENSEVIKIQGPDKKGRPILRIVGKYFPANILKGESAEAALKGYLRKRILPELQKKTFAIVYIHTRVNRHDNFPGLSVLRSVLESVPDAVRESIRKLFFIHPGLQSRIFFFTFGSIFFGPWLYAKLKYIGRVEYLKPYMTAEQLEIPDFVREHDGTLEIHPLWDYGIIKPVSVEMEMNSRRWNLLDDFYDNLLLHGAKQPRLPVAF
ncbi:protein GDAP2 [Carex littledalei]|uniref:Protein GDAP2 n=1 Tax=Carex littledalei TaxID=544730 RepID=A0A833RIS2_9POAL|nr:protein GDAP2 [Carex littledalei]